MLCFQNLKKIDEGAMCHQWGQLSYSGSMQVNSIKQSGFCEELGSPEQRKFEPGKMQETKDWSKTLL